LRAERLLLARGAARHCLLVPEPDILPSSCAMLAANACCAVRRRNGRYQLSKDVKTLTQRIFF
jgi:hypothetical protein